MKVICEKPDRRKKGLRIRINEIETIEDGVRVHWEYSVYHEYGVGYFEVLTNADKFMIRFTSGITDLFDKIKEEDGK